MTEDERRQAEEQERLQAQAKERSGSYYQGLKAGCSRCSMVQMGLDAGF